MPYGNFLLELGRLVGRSVPRIRGTDWNEPELDFELCPKWGSPTHLALIAVLVAELSSQGLDYRREWTKVELTPKKPRGGGRRGQLER